MSAWSLQTLGAFRFCRDERECPVPPTQKSRALLTYLVWNRGMEIARERVVELFWSDLEPERGRSNLNTSLWSIRRSLREAGVDPDTMLTANKTRLSWLGEVTLDVAEFESRANDERWEVRRSAIELYRGDFLDGDYSDWAIATRERADAIFEALLGESVDVDRDLRSARILIDRGTMAEAPYDLVAANEIAHGRRASATAVANRYRAVLAELDAEPSLAFEARFVDMQPAGDEPKLPFCGRVQALSSIDGSLRRVLSGGRVTLLLSAEPGAGKSAMLQHAMFAARRLKLYAVNVNGVEDDARPFGPWTEVHDSMTGTPFAESDVAGDATALSTALLKAAGKRSCFFVDDAQYLRGDAIAVLIQLAQRRPNGLGLIMATRPEGLRALLPQISDATRIDLSPLSHGEIYEGLRRIAPDDAEPIARFIHARSGGNPFFASRLFESLAHDGHLRRTDAGDWKRTQSSLDAAVPRDLREHIEARLYAYGEDAATVACALALDVRASADDLVAVCGFGESRTFDAIDTLLSLSLIEPDEHGSEFRFAHDIIRETAASCLNSGRRARLHVAFAERLAGDARRESVVRRAQHLRAGGQTLAAAEAYALAAAAMLTANAWRDALLCVEAGIELARELLDSPAMNAAAAALHEIGARAQEERGAREAALDHANQRVIHARKTDDSLLLARALARRAWSIMEMGDPAAALGGIDEALALSRALGDDEQIAYALTHRSLCLQYLGDEGALDVSRETIAVSDRLGIVDARCAARERFVAAACVWLHLDEAERVADEASAIVHGASPQFVAMVGIRRSSLHYLRGRLAEASRELEPTSVALHSKHVPTALRSGMILPLIYFAFAAQAATNARAEGNWDAALAHAEAMLHNPLADGYSRRGFARLHLIEALLGRGGRKDLARVHEETLMLPLDPPAPNLFGMSLTRESAIARLAARSGAADARERIAQAATALLQRASAPLDADVALETLALDAASMGSSDVAERLRAEALTVRARRLARTTPAVAEANARARAHRQ